MRSTAIILATAFAAALAPAASAADPRPPAEQTGAKETKPCKKLPAGKRILKLNLKPDSEVSDVVAWMSAISCKAFLFTPSDLQGKRVTVMAPQLMTLEEAYRLFTETLTSVGLKVEPLSREGGQGEVLRIFPMVKPGH